MGLSTIDGDLRVAGTLTPKIFNPPAGSIGKDAIKSLAGIQASKLEHQHSLRYDQADGSAVVAETRLIHLCRAVGTVVAVEAALATVPGAGDSVTIDIQKGNQSSAFASILAASLTIDENDAARQTKTATLNTTSLADGDLLQVVITVAGTTAQGLLVTTTVRENAEP